MTYPLSKDINKVINNYHFNIENLIRIKSNKIQNKYTIFPEKLICKCLRNGIDGFVYRPDDCPSLDNEMKNYINRFKLNNIIKIIHNSSLVYVQININDTKKCIHIGELLMLE